MKKTLIITIGIVLILAVIAIWLYLLFFGTPKETDDVFVDLGFPVEQGDTTGQNNPEPTEQPMIKKQLRQLSTRSVAGFSFTPGPNIVRLTERGVGHVYDIDITTQAESKISGQTIPKTISALFSSLGEVVILETEGATRSDFSLGIINDSEELLLTALPDMTQDHTFYSSTTVAYAQKTASGLTGYVYDTISNTASEAFSIPLRDGKVVWTESVDDVYAYASASDTLRSGLYKITNNALQPKTPLQYSFVSAVHSPYVIFSGSIPEVGLQSYSLNTTNNETRTLPVLTIPEKCISQDTSTLWCAAPFDEPLSIENWYKGTQQSPDSLWKIDLTDQTASLILDFLITAGRVIDVSDITINQAGDKLLFTNKIDNSLWLYEIEK